MPCLDLLQRRQLNRGDDSSCGISNAVREVVGTVFHHASPPVTSNTNATDKSEGDYEISEEVGSAVPALMDTHRRHYLQLLDRRRTGGMSLLDELYFTRDLFATGMGMGMEVGSGSSWGSLTSVQYTYFAASYLPNVGSVQGA
jgi:hypothetical protein